MTTPNILGPHCQPSDAPTMSVVPMFVANDDIDPLQSTNSAHIPKNIQKQFFSLPTASCTPISLPMMLSVPKNAIHQPLVTAISQATYNDTMSLKKAAPVICTPQLINNNSPVPNKCQAVILNDNNSQAVPRSLTQLETGLQMLEKAPAHLLMRRLSLHTHKIISISFLTVKSHYRMNTTRH